MLKKLFAYDFRCISRLTLPALIGMVLTSLLSLLFLWVMVASTNGNAVILSILGGFGFAACFFILILFAAAPAYINYFHFGKNLFFDEGYLTMVLPASEHQILLSKLLAGFLWLLLDGVMALLSLAILFFGASYIFGAGNTMLPDLAILAEEIGAIFGQGAPLVAPLYVLYAIVYAAFEVVLGMTVITFGCLMMPKHKIIGILLTYMVTNWIVSLINQLISSFFSFSLTMSAIGVSEVNLYATPIVMTLTVAGMTVLCYFLTHTMLKKKINLE